MLTRTALRQAISQSFSIEELEILCADLGIDPESIPGRDSGKDYWITQILAHFQRRKQMPALLAALQERRPDVAWDAPPAAPAAPWWDSLQTAELPAARGDAQGDAQGDVQGDMIVANISNSSGVAVGKNIALNLGAPTPDDKQAAVGRVISKAGDAALLWARQRFGA